MEAKYYRAPFSHFPDAAKVLAIRGEQERWWWCKTIYGWDWYMCPDSISNSELLDNIREDLCLINDLAVLIMTGTTGPKWKMNKEIK